MPIKWTAPEILLGNVAELSTQSDVYVQYVWVIDQVWGQYGLFERLCLRSRMFAKTLFTFFPELSKDV